jgi:LPS-assembly lipoprotein
VKRRALLSLALATALAGCGFEPMHAHRGGAAGGLPAIRIEPIADRSGQILRNYLLDRLSPQGVPARAEYMLRVRLQEPRQTLTLRRDDVISRLSYGAVANFELRGPDGRRVVTGSTSYSTDYEVTNSEFATLMALQSARERVLELVSDDIRNQIVAGLPERR